MSRKRLGELLLESGWITPEQLEGALSSHRQTGQRLGEALVSLGFLGEAQLRDALAHALGLRAVRRPGARVDAAALKLLRGRFCLANDLVPLSVDPGRKTLVVAMADPSDLPTIEEIEFTTGHKVHPVIASLTEVREAIRQAYPEEARALSLPPPRRERSREAIAQALKPKTSSRSTPPARAVERRSPLRLSRDPDEGLVRLETKFWALLRALEKKGVISREEFLRELAGRED